MKGLINRSRIESFDSIEEIEKFSVVAMTVDGDQSTQSKTVEAGQKNEIDYNHPLFLSPTDVSVHKSYRYN